jgi:hypothetical protein
VIRAPALDQAFPGLLEPLRELVEKVVDITPRQPGRLLHLVQVNGHSDFVATHAPNVIGESGAWVIEPRPDSSARIPNSDRSPD